MSPTPDPGVRAAAEQVFGDRMGLAERFAAALITHGIERGLLGPREADDVWDRHLLNSAAIADLVPPRARVVDLGSGAGLPGIPLAIARPDLRVTLVEPKQRRVDFLTEICADLGLAVTVLRARATPAGLVRLPESAGPVAVGPLAVGPVAVGPVEVVTARAVASLADLASWAAPLLYPSGVLLAVKGESAAAELERDRSLLARYGLGHAVLSTVAVPGAATTTIVALSRGAAGAHGASRCDHRDR